MLLNNIKLLHGQQPVSLSVKDGLINEINSPHKDGSIYGIGAQYEDGLINGTKARHENESIYTINHQHKNDAVHIQFADALALPGLMNSHDHLDFNCFSPLGKNEYNNYTEWGNHIHEKHQKEITDVLRIPQKLRTAWGMYKNLLAGVTTVVNHGASVHIDNPLIHIHQEMQSLHSVSFEKNWKWKLNNPLLKNKIACLHVGEGTDQTSKKEIDELLRYNWLNRDLVGIHGVAMDAGQAKKFKALVWCPVSNRLLLNKHADIRQLKTNTRVVLGTDSTLTGDWNIWHHLRLARSLKQANDEELFNMTTAAAAGLWNINTGEMKQGKNADILIVKNKTACPGWDDFYQIDPEDILMVLHKGKIRLFDESLLDQVKMHVSEPYSPISIKGTVKFVEGDLPALKNEILSYYPAGAFPFENLNLVVSSGSFVPVRKSGSHTRYPVI